MHMFQMDREQNRNLVSGRTSWLSVKKTVFMAFGGFFLLACSALAQNQSSDKNMNPIGFGSPDIRYGEFWNADSNEGTGRIQLKGDYSLVAWKGERVSMQLLFQAHQKIVNLRVSASDLTSGDKKDLIKSSAVKTGFVRYVLSNAVGKSGSGCGIDTATRHLARIVADGIDYSAKTDVAAGTNQPVWLTLHVPSEARPGSYKGKLEVSYELPDTPGGADKTKKDTLTYEVLVKNRSLPRPGQWKFHLDLWQYPGSVARWYHVKPWSPEHFSKMRPYIQMLAAAGQKVITASIINDPWNGQTYDPYTSMVQWTKKKDGKWRYDYSIFDKWVSYMMGLGIDQQINCYSMVPWHNTFAYYDEATGTNKSLVAKPGTSEYDAFWRGMLEDFARHLKAKGWFDKTTIAMDERPLEAMEKVIQLIKGLPEPFKISLAGSYHRSLDKDIYDYSITTREQYDSAVLSRRMAAGLPTTYYTCCTEDHPNTFSFSPPAEAAFIPLLSAARGLSGYLRWAYNAWPAQPLTDSRFGSWSSGDTYFVYPGPGSSIRYEQLIRGIQDYEKIRLLKQELAVKKDDKGLAKLNRELGNCTVEQLREAGATALVGSLEHTLDEL